LNQDGCQSFSHSIHMTISKIKEMNNKKGENVCLCLLKSLLKNLTWHIYLYLFAKTCSWQSRSRTQRENKERSKIPLCPYRTYPPWLKALTKPHLFEVLSPPYSTILGTKPLTDRSEETIYSMHTYYSAKFFSYKPIQYFSQWSLMKIQISPRSP
jgi:hypothetical protein